MAVSLSVWKKLTFGLVVSIFVVGIGFGLLEAGLRLAGFGHSTSFFRQERDAQGVRWWRENRWVTAPYFPPELIRRPQSIRLPVEKAPNAYRIFVLGSSAAMGDPEPAFSLARQLDVLLREAYPEIHFEVVNAGITAINSHVVRALASDCAKLQPDLFIVYEGNNEVIGPYGPGTVFSPFLGSSSAIRAGRIIKATRTGQLLAKLARTLGSSKKTLDDWGGMQMFLKNEIDRDDPRLVTTQTLFRENLLAIAEAGRRAGAGVFLCTVLTNQKDFGPFVSRHRSGLSEADKKTWQVLVDSGEEAKLREALKIDDHFAELHFRLGRLCLEQNRLAEAKTFFQNALDLDALRFRTDSRLNEVIRNCGTAPGVTLIDLEAAASRSTSTGVVGDDFLYEHVHLNFQGTYQMARVLFSQVSDELVKTGKIKMTKGEAEVLTVAEVRQRLAYTTYEQAMILREMQARVARPPFTAQSDNVARQKFYAERATLAAKILSRPETKDGLVAVYEHALTVRPDDWLLRRNIGMAYVGLGLAERALPLLEKSVAIIPDDADSLFALGMAQRQLGQNDAAAKTFASLRKLEPRYPGVP
ncbi:MAG: tetratricopeptide repeat protein [Nibricoccus sp.]